MSHILKNVLGITLGKPYAAVQVQVKSNKLIICEGISILKPDTKVARLPEKFKVYTEDGEEILPSKGFYITIETINPYHMVLDME